MVRGSEAIAAELFEFAKHIARTEYHRGLEAYQGAMRRYRLMVYSYGQQILLEAQEAVKGEEEAGSGGPVARGSAGSVDG